MTEPTKAQQAAVEAKLRGGSWCTSMKMCFVDGDDPRDESKHHRRIPLNIDTPEGREAAVTLMHQNYWFVQFTKEDHESGKAWCAMIWANEKDEDPLFEIEADGWPDIQKAAWLALVKAEMEEQDG